MAMTVADFIHEQTALSRTLSRSEKITIEFTGDMAATNGKVIFFPALPVAAKMTNDQVAVMRGFLDHETAHNRHSDFTLFRELSADGTPGLKHAVNALEDMRIERLSIKKFPGSLRNLEATANAMSDLAPRTRKFLSDPRAVPLAATWRGRQRAGMNIPGDRERLMRMPATVIADIDSYLDRVDKATCTRDIIPIAKDLLAKYPAEKADDKGKGGDGDDSKEENEASDIDGDGDSSEAEAEATVYENDSPCFNPNVSKAIEAAAKEILKTGGHASSEGVVVAPDIVRRHDGEMPFVLRTAARDKYKRDHRDTEDSLRNQSLRLRRQAERLVMAQRKRSWRSGHLSGRLDTSRLISASRGEERVWRQREESPDIDTAVSILVDHSASMTRCKRRTASETVILLGNLLSNLDVPFTVKGFTAHMNEMSSYDKSRVEKLDSTTVAEKTVVRTAPIVHNVYKNFNESWRSSSYKLAHYRIRSGYDNADADSILFEWRLLRQRTESKKLLIVISDGLPAFPVVPGKKIHGSYGRIMNADLQAAIKAVRDEGCTLIGLGIHTNHVERMYAPLGIDVNAITDLDEAAIGMLLRQLLHGRRS